MFCSVSRPTHRNSRLYRRSKSVHNDSGSISNFSQQCPDQEIAIAHDDDLKTIKGVVRMSMIFLLRCGTELTTGRSDRGRSREFLTSK